MRKIKKVIIIQNQIQIQTQIHILKRKYLKKNQRKKNQEILVQIIGKEKTMKMINLIILNIFQNHIILKEEKVKRRIQMIQFQEYLMI